MNMKFPLNPKPHSQPNMVNDSDSISILKAHKLEFDS